MSTGMPAHKPAPLHRQSGPIQPGYGLTTGILSLFLSSLVALSVLAFHFPEYLSTPDLRKKYDVGFLRQVMLCVMVIAGGLAIANIAWLRSVKLNVTALLILILAIAAGGNQVSVDPNFADNTPYIGLDWFVLDLLASGLLFIGIEKLFPLHKKQPIFRPGWQTDFTHFFINHLMVGLALVIVNFAIHRLFGWLVWPPLQDFVSGLPFVVEVLAVLLVADLVQYWTHRAYHEVPFLWRFHSVHHSAEYMDWMAGSRLHVFELITTRVSILGVLYVLGFSESAMNVYILVVGFQAVFNHANVRVPKAFSQAPLKWLIVTPDFHHWHHSSEHEALDRNYAAHFAFIDYVFGTAVKSDRRFPEKYGVLGDYMPEGWVRQQIFPFTWKK